MKRTLQVSLFLCLFCFGAIAQEQIDVKSMTMSLHRSGLTSSFSLTATNANNQEVVYSYHDATSITFVAPNFVGMCQPCRANWILGTVGWGGTTLSASLNSTGTVPGLRARITLSTPATSDNALITRSVNRRPTTVRGRTNFSVVKIEIIEGQNTVIAVDNDVVLDGSYVLRLGRGRDANQNSIVTFAGITYSFDEPRN